MDHVVWVKQRIVLFGWCDWVKTRHCRSDWQLGDWQPETDDFEVCNLEIKNDDWQLEVLGGSDWQPGETAWWTVWMLTAGWMSTWRLTVRELWHGEWQLGGWYRADWHIPAFCVQIHKPDSSEPHNKQGFARRYTSRKNSLKIVYNRKWLWNVVILLWENNKFFGTFLSFTTKCNGYTSVLGVVITCRLVIKYTYDTAQVVCLNMRTINIPRNTNKRQSQQGQSSLYFALFLKVYYRCQISVKC